MAIEPISTAMSYQVQSAPQITKPVQPTEHMDVKSDALDTQAFDATTVKITEVDPKGEGTSNSGNESGANNTQSNSDQLKKAVENINKNLSDNMSNNEAVFGIHEGTNRITIKIVDKKTKEVVKELPPEKTLDMIAKAWELAGILVDEKR